VRVLAAFVAVTMPLCPLAAGNGVLPVGQPIELLIADLESGKIDEAAARISGIFTLGDEEDRLVTTSRQFAELVSECTPTQLKSRKFGTGLVVHNFRWSCGGTIYEASLGADQKSGLVEVVDVEDDARIKARSERTNVVLSPAAPMRTETEEERIARLEQDSVDRTAVLAALEETIWQGSSLPSTAFISEKSNFTLGYRLLESSTFVAEMDGNGAVELKKQFDWLKANLGNVVDVSCKQSPLAGDSTFMFMSCTAKTDRPGHGYTAILNTRGRLVRQLQINYMNEKSFRKNEEYLRKSGAI
jgi:hypothetical protein